MLRSLGEKLPREGAVRSFHSHASYCSVPAGTGSKTGLNTEPQSWL